MTATVSGRRAAPGLLEAISGTNYEFRVRISGYDVGSAWTENVPSGPLSESGLTDFLRVIKVSLL